MSNSLQDNQDRRNIFEGYLKQMKSLLSQDEFQSQKNIVQPFIQFIAESIRCGDEYIFQSFCLMKYSFLNLFCSESIFSCLQTLSYNINTSKLWEYFS